MKQFIPLTALALLLSACGGGGSNTDNTLAINITGEWTGGLETTDGGGLGAISANLTQAAAPSTAFTGKLFSPLFGVNSPSTPVVGDVVQGTFNIDTSVEGINKALAFTCNGTFTNKSYRGTCQMPQEGGGNKFVLFLGRK